VCVCVCVHVCACVCMCYAKIGNNLFQTGCSIKGWKGWSAKRCKQKGSVFPQLTDLSSPLIFLQITPA